MPAPRTTAHRKTEFSMNPSFVMMAIHARWTSVAQGMDAFSFQKIAMTITPVRSMRAITASAKIHLLTATTTTPAPPKAAIRQRAAFILL